MSDASATQGNIRASAKLAPAITVPQLVGTASTSATKAEVLESEASKENSGTPAGRKGSTESKDPEDPAL